MLKAERHQIILHELGIHNRVLLSDMAQLLQVSVDTVRRDIAELQRVNKLKRVHGGALSLGFNSHGPAARIYAREKKAQIAQKALELIKPGQVILLSGGTTNLELARRLPSKMPLHCFTPSLPIAVQLLGKPQIEVVLIGGQVSRDSQIALGGLAINTLADIKVDVCFLGTNAIDPELGLTEIDWEIVQLKKAMVKSASLLVCPVISEKLGTRQRFGICGLQALDVLITELDPMDPKLKAFKIPNLQIR